MEINALLEGMVKVKASDLHLKVGSPPMMRIHGDLRPVDSPVLTAQDTENIVNVITPARKRQGFDQIGTADFSYSIPKVARFRVNIFHQRGSVSIAIRQVSFSIPSMDNLDLPEAIKNIAKNKRGLVLVTGVTGSGKSTTLAAIIEHINQTRREHIITIEDPIEYLYSDKKSIVNQIELGVDIDSFENALRHVLRQDPDIILLGELRDKVSVKTALSAVETGHMVLSTLHTPDAKQTITRILDFFSADEENLILSQLSLGLQAVISQRLLKRADNQGRIPAVEVLVNSPIIAKLIKEGRIVDIKQAIQNKDDGMQTFNQALVELTRLGKITLEEGLKYCDDESAYKRNVKGIYSEGDRTGLIGV